MDLYKLYRKLHIKYGGPIRHLREALIENESDRVQRSRCLACFEAIDNAGEVLDSETNIPTFSLALDMITAVGSKRKDPEALVKQIERYSKYMKMVSNTDCSSKQDLLARLANIGLMGIMNDEVSERCLISWDECMQTVFEADRPKVVNVLGELMEDSECDLTSNGINEREERLESLHKTVQRISKSRRKVGARFAAGLVTSGSERKGAIQRQSKENINGIETEYDD